MPVLLGWIQIGRACREIHQLNRLIGGEVLHRLRGEVRRFIQQYNQLLTEFGLEMLKKADRHLAGERSATLQDCRFPVFGYCSEKIHSFPRGRHPYCRPLADRKPPPVEVCSNRFPRLINRDDCCVFVTAAYFFSTVSSNSSRSSSSAEAGCGRGLFTETPALCIHRRTWR